MQLFFGYMVIGLVAGCLYALTATGMVVTYTTSGIFNFAHGAIGMFMAFTFWQLRVAWGWPAIPALILVVLVLAPLLGALIERLLMRGLAGAPATTTMVVTVGLMVALIGFAQWIWPSSVQRQLPPFFGASKFRLFGAYVTYHQLLTMMVAIAVAIGLRFLLFRTRTGTAMRAVVDDRGLVSLNGARTGRISMLAWAIGSSLAAIAGILVQFLSSPNVLKIGGGLALALIMLSLVLLVGYGGQPSLCQMSFVGLGAYAMATFGHGSPVGVVMAVLVAAPVGALVALPAMRLQGLYLALATLAFAVLMDNLVFARLYGNLSSKTVPRPHFLGLSFDSERAMFILMAVVFALLGMLVLAVRRGRFGRRLAAMRDSPAATTMLGISIPVTKVVVFTISAGLAWLAGAMFGGLQGSAGPTDFLSFQSLPVLLLAMVGGVTTVSGALIGGLLFAVRGYISGALWPVFYLATGASAVLLARNPNGIAGELYDRLDRLAFWRRPGGLEPLSPLLREEV